MVQRGAGQERNDPAPAPGPGTLPGGGGLCPEYRQDPGRARSELPGLFSSPTSLPAVHLPLQKAAAFRDNSVPGLLVCCLPEHFLKPRVTYLLKGNVLSQLRICLADIQTSRLISENTSPSLGKSKPPICPHLTKDIRESGCGAQE